MNKLKQYLSNSFVQEIKPKSQFQKYRLTAKGMNLKNIMESGI